MDAEFPNLSAEVVAAWRSAPDHVSVELAPDWVCEVLSEGTEAHDRGRKMRLYRRADVAHCWLVDPSSACWRSIARPGGASLTQA